MLIAAAPKGSFYEDMAQFGHTIKRLRKERHLSQDDLAKAVGVTAKAVYAWERMPANTIQGTHYRKLAEVLGMTTSDLDREWRATKIDQSVGDPGRRGIPLINKAAAGRVVDYHECSMVDSGQGQWYVLRDGIEDPNAFAVIITGDSMEPFLTNGGVAYFAPMDTDGLTHHKRIQIPEGHVVFVRFGPDAKHEGCTVARWFRKGEKMQLVKDNKKYKPMVVKPEEILRMAALVRHDAIPGFTKMFPASEQLQSKGDGDRQVEGQIFPDDVQKHPEY